MSLFSMLRVVSAVFLLGVFTTQANAHCFLPDAEEGDAVYNITESVYQGCTDFGWYSWNEPGSGGGGCTNPAGVAGDLNYNPTSETFQICNPNGWQALHVPGSGGGGCTDPAGVPGDMVYNTTFRTFQGCNPHGWQAFHFIPIETKATASDGAASDSFGGSVSVSGDVALVGASGDDDNGSGSGSAYIFRDAGGGAWAEEAKLTASDGSIDDQFGRAVSVSGDIAIVGAFLDDDNGSESGSAYVFRDAGGGVWNEEAKLTASDGATLDQFGSAVSVSGDIAIVGASSDDDNGSSSGSAYVFRDAGGGVWNEEAKLTASDGAALDRFGRAVSVSGDIAIVGAFLDDDNGSSSGSAYVFRDAGGGVWTQEAKLTASDGAASDFFGLAVSVSGGIAIIGAQNNDDNGSNSGSAYIFRDAGGGTWVEEVKLTASDAAADDRFGVNVSISNGTAMVGAPLDDDNGSSSGSAYVFRDAGGGVWKQEVKLTALDGTANDVFSTPLSISGNVALIAAIDDDDNGSSSGSVYFYQPVP